MLIEAQYRYICKQLHSNNGTVYKNITDWLAAKGIKQEPSAPYI